MLQRISKVAYLLNFLTDAHIHLILHVSYLNKKIGKKAISQSTLPLVGDDGRIRLKPITLLDRQLVKKNNGATVKALVQWSDSLIEVAT